MQTQGFFNELEVYQDAPGYRWSIKKMLVAMALGAVLGAALIWPAHSQNRVRQGTVAICSTEADATTLLTKLVDEGMPAALSWMEEPENTCALRRTSFVLGAPVGPPRKVGEVEWTVVHVSPPDGSSNDYSVVPLSVTLTSA